MCRCWFKISSNSVVFHLIIKAVNFLVHPRVVPPLKGVATNNCFGRHIHTPKSHSGAYLKGEYQRKYTHIHVWMLIQPFVIQRYNMASCRMIFTLILESRHIFCKIPYRINEQIQVGFSEKVQNYIASVLLPVLTRGKSKSDTRSRRQMCNCF